MVVSVELDGQFSYLVLFPLFVTFELLLVWCIECIVYGFRWHLGWHVGRAACTGSDKVIGTGISVIVFG